MVLTGGIIQRTRGAVGTLYQQWRGDGIPEAVLLRCLCRHQPPSRTSPPPVTSPGGSTTRLDPSGFDIDSYFASPDFRSRSHGYGHAPHPHWTLRWGGATLVSAPWTSRISNRMVPAVESGPMTPSTEKLALWPWTRLQGRLSGSARWSGWRCWSRDVPVGGGAEMSLPAAADPGGGGERRSDGGSAPHGRGFPSPVHRSLQPLR